MYYMWPWTTKPVIRFSFFFKDLYRYNYLNICNLRVKITFKVVQMKFLAMHSTNQKLSFDIYGWTFTKYLLETWSLLNILMIFDIKEKSIVLTLTMCCWLLLQIYPCCGYTLVLRSRLTNVKLRWYLPYRKRWCSESDVNVVCRCYSNASWFIGGIRPLFRVCLSYEFILIDCPCF